MDFISQSNLWTHIYLTIFYMFYSDCSFCFSILPHQQNLFYYHTNSLIDYLIHNFTSVYNMTLLDFYLQ